MRNFLACILFVKEFGKDAWVEFDTIEKISNNLNTKWTKKSTIDYFFQERQRLKFEV